jgi:hypothetical protein
MSIAGWPFLISRARISGHREVVIPQFMVGTPLAEILPQAAGAEETSAGHAVVREVNYPGIGPLSVVFRVFRATSADFGLGAEGSLLDSSSRPILAIEGLVIRQSARACERAGLSQTDLDQAHKAVVPSYQRFWREDRQYQVEASVQVKAAASGQILILQRAPAWKAPASMPEITSIRPQRSAKRRIAGIAVAAAGAALAATVINHVLGGQPLTIGPLATGLTSCTNHGQNYENTGDTASQQCQLSGTAVQVRVFRFVNGTTYQAALNRDISTMATRAGPVCPPGHQYTSGSTPWQNQHNPQKPHSAQRLYCGLIISGQPTYLWTSPATDSFAIATASTYAEIQQWWKKYDTSG